jgi:hypothetical protein
MKTFRWTVPTLPLTPGERDGNKGNARLVHHSSEIEEEDLIFAAAWERKLKRGMYFYLGLTAAKVTLLFLVIGATAATLKGGLEPADDLILAMGFFIALTMRLKAGHLKWRRNHRRYESIIKNRPAA